MVMKFEAFSEGLYPQQPNLPPRQTNRLTAKLLLQSIVYPLMGGYDEKSLSDIFAIASGFDAGTRLAANDSR
jgi:hypothetical protein